jgi:hypothetical protein
MAIAGTDILPLLDQVRARADTSGVFGPTDIRDGMLICRAKNAAAPASYRVFAENGRVWISLVMADRWLSESIESSLVDHGDHLEDLIEEELAELGYHGPRLTFEHFRSDDKLFTFRTPVPGPTGGPAGVENVTKLLLGYEACFRNLGDMDAGESEE